MYDIAIVGGGASGLIAAVQIKRLAPDCRCILLERLGRVGKKLMATGNGRCNLTNLSAGESDYHGGTSLMRVAMRRYPPEAVIEFFRSIGVEPLVEGAKVYPLSGQASSVLDALRLTLSELGAEVQCDYEVASIDCVDGGFVLNARDGRCVQTARVIMSAGSMSAPPLGGTELGYKLMKDLGHRIAPCLPALVQLKTPVEPIRALTGIRFEGGISIAVNGETKRTERGEVLFTEYGLSGPSVLQLSRIASASLAARKQVSVTLSILPEPPLGLLRRRREAFFHRALENFLTGMMNKRLGQTLLKLSGCIPLSREAGSLTDFELETLAALMAEWTLPVVGTQGFASAQVAAGGVRTEDFDPTTLQSRLVPGLFATGELLDIDGDCGGFNLQWAWASGLLAADGALGERS